MPYTNPYDYIKNITDDQEANYGLAWALHFLEVLREYYQEKEE